MGIILLLREVYNEFYGVNSQEFKLKVHNLRLQFL